MNPATGTRGRAPGHQSRPDELAAEAARLLGEGYRLAAVAAHDDSRRAAGRLRVLRRPAGPAGRAGGAARPRAPGSALPGRALVPGQPVRARDPRPVRDRPRRPPLPAPPRPAPALAGRLAPDAPRRRAAAADAGRRRAVPVRQGRGTRRLRDPGRPRARRAHRARALPLLRGRGDDPEDEGPAVVRAQGRRAPLRGPGLRQAVPLAECDLRRQRGRRTASPTAWRSRTPARSRCPTSAARLRALLLELERLYNHVADIGALCNDVGFGLAQAWALTLREKLLRLNAGITGHRLLRGAIRPGQAVRRLPAPAELAEIRQRFDELIGLATSNTLVMDRFTGTAVLNAADAAGLGTSASSAAPPASPSTPGSPIPSPTSATGFRPAVQPGGDVMARFSVRAEEARTSLTLIAELAGAGQRAHRHGAARAAPRRCRAGDRRRLAGQHRPSRRAGPSGTARPVQDRRSVLPQLARAVRRPRRHDRPRLPPRQQELQPLLRRQRPLAHRGRPPGRPGLPGNGSAPGDAICAISSSAIPVLRGAASPGSRGQPRTMPSPGAAPACDRARPDFPSRWSAPGSFRSALRCTWPVRVGVYLRRPQLGAGVPGGRGAGNSRLPARPTAQHGPVERRSRVAGAARACVARPRQPHAARRRPAARRRAARYPRRRRRAHGSEACGPPWRGGWRPCRVHRARRLSWAARHPASVRCPHPYGRVMTAGTPVAGQVTGRCSITAEELTGGGGISTRFGFRLAQTPGTRMTAGPWPTRSSRTSRC